MSRFNWMNHPKHTVLKQNFSELNATELLPIIDQCHEEVKKKGKTDIVLLTNIENVKFDRNVSHHFQELMTKNKPYVKESCIYGVGALQKVTIETVAKMTGRKINIFKTEAEALNWLEKL